MNDDKSFLWGVTQIGQQTEGGCDASDWARAGQSGFVPVCDRGVDYWNRYVSDHDLVQDLGCNVMRVSVEWARIEPKEGVFDREALEHYREMLQDLHRRDIRVMLGLWHYSLPEWFARDYGLHHRNAVEIFGRFSLQVCTHLGDLVDDLVILNEPSVYVGLGYLQGHRPPFYHSRFLGLRVMRNFITMHKQVYRQWKEMYPEIRIGSTHLMNDLTSKNGSIIEKVALRISRAIRYGYIIRRTKSDSDFVGLNYYTADQIEFRWREVFSGGVCGFFGTNDWHSPDVWRSFAEGFRRVILQASHYNLPIIVTENGKPSEGGLADTDRQEFLAQHIDVLKDLCGHGVNVQGYMHHALMDCYEWTSGYDFKFGLVYIDRDTLERTKRESFYTYQQCIRNSDI